MNTNTQKFLQQLKITSGLYQEHKEQIDHEKAYNQLLMVLSDVFNDYESEFTVSISYISESRKIQESKRIEIETLSAKIRATIKAYNLINPMDLEEYELDCLNQSVQDLSVVDLKNHFSILNSMFMPIKGSLLNIGISTAMLKELEAKIHDLDVALPFNMKEMESKIEKFKMASKAINLLEKLEFEYSESNAEVFSRI
jgi:hypothetical protein